MPPLWRDRQLRRDHVHAPVGQGGQQLSAGQRHEHDVDLQVAGLDGFVDLLLERPQRLVGHAALLALVDEVVRPVESDAGSDDPPLHHFVEIASEALIHQGSHFGRQNVVWRGHFWQRGFSGRARVVPQCLSRRRVFLDSRWLAPLTLAARAAGGEERRSDEGGAEKPTGVPRKVWCHHDPLLESNRGSEPKLSRRGLS